MTQDTADLQAIADLALAFGKVNRATKHADGSFETDTTHTVMLCLAVLYVAEEDPKLNPLRALEFALVHDLAEAYAGDTNTLRALDEAGQADKDRREEEAIQRIEQECPPFIGRLIRDYESQVLREARLVKLLDKIMPKLTHPATNYSTIRDAAMAPEELAGRLVGQAEAYCADDLPYASKLFEATSEELLLGYRRSLDEGVLEFRPRKRVRCWCCRRARAIEGSDVCESCESCENVNGCHYREVQGYVAHC